MVKQTSLVSDDERLMAEWNWEKNDSRGIKPYNFSTGSNRKVWWKCTEGHEWQAVIYNRTAGNGCPYCAGRYAVKGVNDLQTVNPELAKEWNYEKNEGLTPNDVLPNSNKKVWWKCSEGHEWQAMINSRNNGSRCPYCAGRIIISGINDLQAVNPELAKEWNYEKNEGLTPNDVLPNSNKKVWWKCSEGHEWQAMIANRNKGIGCPYCSGLFAIEGVNDLQTVNPNLALEWNYEKNKGLTPRNVLPNSNKKVWWKCSQGHEWQAMINHRNKGTGCPYCFQYPTIKVINKDTGEVFNSMTDAAKKYGIRASYISSCCKGERKTSGGYHWEYYCENDK